MRNHFILFSLTISVLCCISLNAQIPADSLKTEPANPAVQYIVTMTNGNMIVGEISNPENNPILLITPYGILTIPKSQIKELKLIRPQSMKKGNYWFPNPNTSRMFFGPTARMLEKGQGYFADYYIFFPSITYAFTNHFTMTGGFSILPGLSLNKQIFYFGPKIGILSKKKWQFAAGALIVRLGDWDEEETLPTFGILYGVTTYGNEDACLTFGLGYGFADTELADKPAVMLGGEKRVSRRISLVSENYIIPEVDPIFFSYGIRFMGEKMSIDLAFLQLTGEANFFPGIPYIDFVFNF